MRCRMREHDAGCLMHIEYEIDFSRIASFKGTCCQTSEIMMVVLRYCNWSSAHPPIKPLRKGFGRAGYWWLRLQGGVARGSALANSYINHTSLVIVGLALSAVPRQAGAQERPAFELGTIVIRSGEAGSDENIGGDQIDATQPTTLNELLGQSPEVVVSGANRTTAQKVYVRGIEETLLNVTVDDARLGGNMYDHSGNFGIDPDFLKRVDIEAGSGSALQGPGALGGAIRYETKDPEDLLMPGQKNGAMLKFSGQTNDSRLTPGVAFYGVPDERFGYLVYGSKSWADNYRDGHGNAVADTDSEPLDTLVKLRFRPSEGHELEFSNTWRQDNGYRAAKSNFGIPPDLPDAAPEDQRFGFRTTSLTYSYNAPDNALVDLRMSAYDTDSWLHRKIDVHQNADWRTRGFDIRNRSELGPVTLSYGYDYSWTESQGNDGAGRNASEAGQNHGLYLQADYAPTQQWLLSAGLRYDHGTLTDIGANKFSGDHLSPNVRLRYELLDGLAVSGSWGEAFRGVQPAPGMTLIWPLGLGAENDTSLDGELARTAEVGIEFDRDGWRAGATAFTSTIDDKIRVWQGRRNPWWRENDGVIKTKGVTAYVGRTWNNWSADLRYNHTEVKYNDRPVSPGDWLNNVTPGGDKLILGLGYEMPDYRLRFGWTSTWVLEQTDLPEDFALSSLPAYHVHDLSIVWSPKENQTYSLAVTNIFDRQYLDHSTAYYGAEGWSNLYEMGRSIRASATIRF